LLVWAETKCPDELAADMQEVYGIDVRTYSDKEHLATLVSQLRMGSRVMGCLNEDNKYTMTEHLLALTEYQLRVIAWQRTEAGAKGTNQPKPPITMPNLGVVKDTKRDMDRVASLLNITI